MDEACAIIVEGDWPPEHAIAVKNKLHIYFQSKKSLGGDCVVQFDDQTNAAKIIFNSPEIRDAVLSKQDHTVTIGKQLIKLMVTKPNSAVKQDDSSNVPKRELTSQEPKSDEYNLLSEDQLSSQPELDVKAPQESSAVVLENIPDDCTQDLLTLLVGNICCLSDKDFILEFIPELSKAVVSFRYSGATEKFLLECKNHKVFTQYNLTVRALEQTKCVRVEDLPADATMLLLKLFFERFGCLGEEPDMIPSENAAIITFMEENDKDKALENRISIGDVQVKVYPYFKSLRSALYGGNRPQLKLPNAFTVSLHPSIWKFLMNKRLFDSISNQMSSEFCIINTNTPVVQLIPDPALLKQKQIVKKHVDDWSKKALDAFNNIISSYTTSEWPISTPLWTKVKSDVNALVKDKILTEIDPTKGILRLAGFTHDIFGMKPIMAKILERAINDLNREENSVQEMMTITPSFFSLLVKDGLHSVKADFPNANLNYNKTTQNVVLYGLHTEILHLKNWILEKSLLMKRQPFKSESSILEFMRMVDCAEMSTDLFLSQGIFAVYTVENGNVILIGCTEKALSDAEKKLKMELSSIGIIVEDQTIIRMPEWQHLKKQLEDSFSTSTKKTLYINDTAQKDTVIVAGFVTPVMEVSKNLRCFVEDHTRIEEVLHLKSFAVTEFIQVRKSQDWKHSINPYKVKVSFEKTRPCIRLSGERAFVHPALSIFKSMTEVLCTDMIVITKAGAKKFFKEQGYMMLSMLLKERSIEVFLQENVMLEELDQPGKSGSKDLDQIFCEVHMPQGATITVRQADICKFRVDAVVNAANEDLKHIGGVALALLQAAGPSLQEHCDAYINKHGTLKPGDSIITEAGRLPSKFVVHAVGPRFRDADRNTTVQILGRAVRQSLCKASDKNCSSIAIPTISSGVFGCPLDLCVETLSKELRKYIEDQSNSSRFKINQFHMVDNNSKTVNAMAQAVCKEFAAYSPKMKPSDKQNNQGHGAKGGWGSAAKYGGTNEFSGGYEAKSHGNRSLEGTNTQRDSPKFFEAEKFEGLKVLETITSQAGLKICLCEGNIQDAQADVIVNTISKNLDLTKGAVSNALLQTAGPELQSDVSMSGPRILDYGDTVISDGYKLKCSKVFHVICPVWINGSDKLLIKIIRECLSAAESNKMTSVSFPAIGTGNLGFPRELVARIMLAEFQEFIPKSLQIVSVIVHLSDIESIESFTAIFKKGFQGPIMKAAQYFAPKLNAQVRKSANLSGARSGDTSLLSAQTLQIGPVTLEVSSGDITKEKRDAIVNSSNYLFSLKAGVSKAILDGAGVQVEHECSQIVGTSLVQQTQIVTKAGMLPCGNIIHVIGRRSPDEIKEVVFSALELCEKSRFVTVAFPALGTGQGQARPTDVSDAMVQAVVDFTKKKKPVHVKSVKFVIFQENMVADFQQSLQKRSGEKVKEGKGIFSKVKDLFLGESSTSSDEEFVMLWEDIEPAVFQLCGETPEDLSKARELIDSLLKKDYHHSPIHDPTIAYFSQEDVEMLKTMQKELTMRVELQKKGQDSFILLQGLTKDVYAAESRIRDMIRKVERNEKRRCDALILGKVINWQYQERGHAVDFDLLTNYDLEMAYLKRQSSVKIKIDKIEYDADLIREVVTRGRKSMQLHRIDLEVVASLDLPSCWDDMKGQGVVLVPLTKGSTEYTEVETAFLSTGLAATITEIKRVQNKTLWKSYMIKKEELESKNQHSNNEKRLFHGTEASKTDQINHNGFNRSYAGAHGAMFGNGTYFAVNPSYSAQGYSKPDANGNKHMYFARVLVGDFTKGKAGMIVPPARSSSSADLYNSVTDNTQNPTMFVIFNDVQAYPEYLITFQ